VWTPKYRNVILIDELADALEEMARDIALIEPDPQDLGG
jgi:REP element-mobilizing transposase RayT